MNILTHAQLLEKHHPLFIAASFIICGAVYAVDAGLQSKKQRQFRHNALQILLKRQGQEHTEALKTIDAKELKLITMIKMQIHPYQGATEKLKSTFDASIQEMVSKGHIRCIMKKPETHAAEDLSPGMTETPHYSITDAGWAERTRLANDSLFKPQIEFLKTLLNKRPTFY